MPKALWLRHVPVCAAVLVCVPLLPPCVAGQSAEPVPASVVILPFSIAGAAAADSSVAANPSTAACPAGVTVDLANVPAEDQTGVVTVIAAELQTQLNKDGFTARVGVPGAAVPAGALVLAGCFTAMDEGSAKKRLVGAGMGGSVLAAQVQISRMADGKLAPLQTFAEESKGRNFGVGSGMLINAMRAKRTSLQGDASNLADKIAKECSRRGKELK